MPGTLPVVSVVVVNFNGLHHLDACFRSLTRQTYPAEMIELILVDNGSHDGSVDFVSEHYPSVTIIQNEHNRGFAPAVNQGAMAASGRYLALINNDAYAHHRWLEEMVSAIEQHREDGVACIGAKMLDWHGERIDFVVGGASFYGFGYQFFYHLPANSVQLTPEYMLFACGGALLVDHDIFLSIGGFDDDYFAYFEDVDFGWRLWICGYKVLFLPDAIVYHHHHGTSGSMPRHQIQTLLERNAMLTVLKNYEDENLYRFLGASLLLAVQRFLAVAHGGDGINWNEFHLGYAGNSATAPQDESETITLSKTTASSMAALKTILEDIPHIWDKRHRVQSQRQRRDTDIFPVFRYPLGSHYYTDPYLLQKDILSEMFRFQDMFTKSRVHQVLIISTDPLYDNLAGPGIRTIQMARYLAPSCYVTLAAPGQANVTIPDVTAVAFQHGDTESLQQLVRQSDIVVLQGFTLQLYPWIEDLRKILVVDLYDPFHLEGLEFFKKDGLERARELTRSTVQALNQQLRAGDFFLCASERQRDLWLGALGSMERLSPDIYAHDPTFQSLIAVVPFGIEPDPPVQQKAVLKGVFPGIHQDDTLILWGGGIWDWLDPLTVIRAMDLVRQQRSDVKLFFLGYHHPNPEGVPEMTMYTRTVQLVNELELEEVVFFNHQWVPYHERASYFLEADIGVSAHLDHLETRFAFRTRLLDYIWAGLPMVVTAGDTLADMVADHGLGHVVPIGDAESFAEALLALVEDTPAQQRIASTCKQLEQEFAWPRVFAPLIAFCQQPHYAADKFKPGPAGKPEAPPHDADENQPADNSADLHAIIAEKNAHIAHLESLVKRLESGKVMRLMRWLTTRRRR